MQYNRSLSLQSFFIIVFTITALTCTSQVLQKRTVELMGGRFDITIVSKDSQSAERYIDTVIMEVTRIEYLISDWKPQTQVSQVNAAAGIHPVKVDREVFELTQRALRFSNITNGGFDISFAAMDRIWKFDGSMMEIPTQEAIKNRSKKLVIKTSSLTASTLQFSLNCLV